MIRTIVLLSLGVNLLASCTGFFNQDVNIDAKFEHSRYPTLLPTQEILAGFTIDDADNDAEHIHIQHGTQLERRAEALKNRATRIKHRRMESRALARAQERLQKGVEQHDTQRTPSFD
ncbi:MAG: hypothetical protein OXC68_01405 [Aestuariivita sp.]|nr:hypothetical protein [Aestuariivita sp.]